DPTPARPVDRGFERQDHSLFEPLAAVRGDPRLLRPGSSDTMPRVVSVRRPVLGEQLANLTVDVTCDHAAPTERDAVVQPATDTVEAISRDPVRGPDADRVGVVRPGPVDPGRGVGEDKVA